MSDKTMVLNLVQKLPEDTTLEEIYRELSFVAALHEAQRQADRGDLIEHERIREDLRTWTTS
jgi:predicted transcriptional regulator